VIELLIEAERALTHGRLDEAERLYRQVADSDPRSSIAVVGLARVALERGDDLAAYLQGRRALSIDPENPMARHLVMRLTEVLAGRGEMPQDAAAGAQVAPDPAAATSPPATEPAAATSPAPANASAPAPSPRPPQSPRPGLVTRFLGRKRRS
jgi:tetratricopeptide (TPR) repeat protein